MNENLEEDVQKEFPPYEIEKLDKRTILNKEIFEYILSIEEPADREKIILDLEEKAENLKILPNFKRALKSYEKKYKDSNNLKNLTKQTHDEIAKKILEQNQIAVYENNICIYEDGVYKNDEESIYKKVIELVPDANTYFRKEVYNYLLLITQKRKINRESGIINFKNGLYSIKNQKLYKHTPKFFSINQINTNLNLQAPKVQTIDNVLNKISCNKEERKRTILEMIGYSMTTSVRLQKAFILYGKTAGNGKSTLINIISELIGNENIGYVALEDLSNNKFATSGIKGKLLDVGSEMTKEYLKDISTFKKWITGDEDEIEEKFKPRQKIRPYAKFIFNANELPKVADKTDAFYRRLQIIPFEAKFTNTDNRNFNFDELITKEALEYLAKISLEAYLNIGDTFSNYEESEKEIDIYKVENNNILSYLNDKDNMLHYLETGTSTKYKKDVYVHYKQYCQDNEFKPTGRNTFYKEILKSGLVKEGAFKGYETFIFDKNYYLKNKNTTQITTFKTP